jgi:hypothetical protein
MVLSALLVFLYIDRIWVLAIHLFTGPVARATSEARTYIGPSGFSGDFCGAARVVKG